MKAIIYSKTYLPGLGQGPFLNPIEIDTEIIKILVRSRARYKIVNDSIDKKPVVEKTIEEIVPPVIEEKQEDIVEEKEEVIPEVVIKEEPNYSEMTVEELKNICKEKGIEFKYKDTKTILIDKILNR